MFEDKVPHFAVVGKSGSGKTKVVTELIERLAHVGYEVASVKHTTGEYTLDDEDKDTWKHGEAGASLVSFSSPLETSFIVKREMNVSEILSCLKDFGEFDVVIIEGMKEADVLKITVDEDVQGDYTYEDNLDEIYDEIKRAVETKKIYEELPKLDCKKCGYSTCWELAEDIVKGGAAMEDCASKKERGLVVTVNGEDIPLGKFPASLMENTLVGMLKSLKGVEEVHDFEIKEQDRDD